MEHFIRIAMSLTEDPALAELDDDHCRAIIDILAVKLASHHFAIASLDATGEAAQ